MRKSLVYSLFTAPLWLAGVNIAQQSPTTSAGMWGDVADDLQIGISTGMNTENLTESQSMLYLTLQAR